MAVITPAHVKQHIADVTPEQIGKCFPVIGPDNKRFYMVENESGAWHDGEFIEYKVTYSPQRGFGCTCSSGKKGFCNVRHKSGVCKHVRWALAASIEEREYRAALAAKEEIEEEQRRLEELPDILDEGALLYQSRDHGHVIILEMERMARMPHAH